MGTYVEFIACPPEGPLGQIVTMIAGFAAWYVTDFAEDGDTQVLGLITAVKEHGVAAFTGLRPDDHAVVDKLVAEFYGFYCDHPRRQQLRKVETSMLRMARYRWLHEEMEGMLTPEVSSLWAYIYVGRPFAPPNRTAGYISDDDASWVSWWSLDEVWLLRRGLPPRNFAGSEDTRDVLHAAHTALEFAEREACGLVVTAF